MDASRADRLLKKKIVILKCHFLLFSATAMDHFLIGLWCTTKSGFYMTITYLMDMSLSKLWDLMMDREIWHAKVYGVTKSWTWLSDCTELIWQLVTTSSIVGPRGRFKALPRAKLVKRKGSWSNLVGCCWPYPLYLSESQRNHYISAVYSAKWMPKCMSHNQCFKSWTKWATKFYLICHIHLTSHQMTATS